MSAGRIVEVRAFAPAHVTGVFRPSMAARDPRGRGSIGAGVVLELGVFARARLAAGGARRVQLSSDLPGPLPISEEVARRLFSRHAGSLSVHLTHQVPIGQGFGSSAAGAAATALATAALVGRPSSEALAIAHLADLFGEGGLGGVASIYNGGGIEFRLRPGIPPWGRVVHRASDDPLIVGIVGGPIPSPAILRSPRWRERIDRASRDLPELLRRPDPERFFDSSERFTDRVGLASDPLRRVIRALRRRGAHAAQAMFGRCFFARPPDRKSHDAIVHWLTVARVPAIEVRPARSGARLLAAGASHPTG